LTVGRQRHPVREIAGRHSRCGAGADAVSPAAAARLIQAVHRPVEPSERLTAREIEVLELVAQGLANKQIAWKLGISEKTIKSHVSTILGKFGLHSRTQAALHACRLRLISAGSWEPDQGSMVSAEWARPGLRCRQPG
jgi:NarL family two-component system response regulator LiaR